MLEPVAGFEIDRFTGRWYELARYPHRFEKNLSNVTATYTLNDDGSVDVVNRGYNVVSLEWKTAKGKAYFKKDPSLGLLKVTFFWPFYGEYKIIRLDKMDYSYAVITSSTFNYLWILSREPQLDQEVLSELLDDVVKLGFDRSRILMVDQSPIK
jgi:apolipoprotein D and lipocalin family protein